MTPTTQTTTPAPAPTGVWAFLTKFLNDADIAEQVALGFAPIAPEASIALMITQGVQKLLALHVATTGEQLDLSTLTQQPLIPIPASTAPAAKPAPVAAS